MGKDEEKQVRRNFWYRQALFKRLSGVWRTLPSNAGHFGFSHADGWEAVEAVRGGRVPLRGVVSGGGLTLDEVALLHLQKDPVKVVLSFNDDARPTVRAESFMTVTATITNRLTRPINPIIRLVPTSPSGGGQDTGLLDSIIVCDGTFTAAKQQEALKRGQERVVEWRVTFLSPGRYGFLVLVEEAMAVEGTGERLSFVSGVVCVRVLPAA